MTFVPKWVCATLVVWSVCLIAAGLAAAFELLAN